MKTKLINIDGKEEKEMNLPKCFDAKIREDVVLKVLEAKKTKQPYAPSLVAGKQHAAKGKIVHRRHVWRSGYGRGMSRVPRKITSRKGSQFNWIAAEVPHARGGMRAHPPKVVSMINTKKINKKEFEVALKSAISATAKEKYLIQKYDSLKNEKIKGVPFVVDSKILSLKTKEFLLKLKKIFGENLFNVAIKKKSVRSGVGKLRGRKYKRNAGAIIVCGEKENIKPKILDSVSVKNLSVKNLAEGGLGRLTVYTEEAIKELENKFKEKKE